MRLLLLLIALSTSSVALAQTVDSPANQRWHWLQTEAWLKQTYSAPKWKLQVRKTKSDTLDIVSTTAQGVRHATYHLLHGQLVAITFHFAGDYDYQSDWIRYKAEFMGGHEWVGKADNARIRSRREGSGGVAYEVQYEAFTRD
jgi:hypothetical protein